MDGFNVGELVGLISNNETTIVSAISFVELVFIAPRAGIPLASVAVEYRICGLVAPSSGTHMDPHVVVVVTTIQPLS